MRRERTRRPTAATLLGAILLVAGGCEPGPREGELRAREARNEAVVRALAEALNAKEYAALDTLLTDDYTRHSQATPAANVRSLEDFVAFLREDVGAFPDARLELETLIPDGDRVAFWGTYTGTQQGRMGVFPPTGERIELEFAGVHRFEGNEIAETWVTWDNLTALVQLGHWEVRPVTERPSPDAYCAVWVPVRAPADEGADAEE